MRRLLCLTVGSGCVAAALLPAVAAVASTAPPGSGLQSYRLSALAPGVQVRQGTESTEAVVPQSLATLRNGPVGFGQSAVVWPGALAGNAGSLLVIAGAPQEARAANSPIRAEATTGSGPEEVVNDDYPGTTMAATAKEDRVSATSTVDNGAVSPVASFTDAETRSVTTVTGAAAVVSEAFSSVSGIDLAGGQVTVEGVTSTARAVGDGRTASATGRTLVSGVRIAGQAVTIGQDGVTVAGTGLPRADDEAEKAVNTALASLKMTAVLSGASEEREGASTSFTAGSLVFSWTQSSGARATVVLGGATVAVSAAPGGPLPPQPGQDPPPLPPGPDPALDGSTPPLGEQPGLEPAVGSGDPRPTAPSGAPPAVAELPALTSAAAVLPELLSPAWTLCALLGAGLLAAGLRRLPDRLLAAPSVACALEETP